jgi:putative SOS response-associated peptidase YedK
MCGRYTHLYTWAQLHQLSTLTTPPVEIPLSYNVAPTQTAPVIRMDGPGARQLDMFRWGLIPSWAKDTAIGGSLINARAETIQEKPAFRAAFKARRCLVPISGFYEWKKIEGEKRKQPYYITGADERPLLLAGLYEHWKGEGGIDSFTIITTSPNELMAKLHDRMPVILGPEQIDAWLESAEPPVHLLGQYPSELLMCREVSTRVNSPRNNDAGCIEPDSHSETLF